MQKLVIIWDTVDRQYYASVDGADECVKLCNIDFLKEYFKIKDEEEVIVIKIHDKGENKFESLDLDESYVFVKKENGVDLFSRNNNGIYINDELVNDDREVIEKIDEIFDNGDRRFGFNFDLYTV